MSIGEHEGDDGTDRLPCGRSADDLLDQVASGRLGLRDAHQASCLHCLAALSEYERLWEPIRQLAARRVVVPPSRIDRVLRQLRGALSEPGFAELDDPTGSIRIAARVVLGTARRSAQSVPGVRVALSRAADHGSAATGVSAGVAGGSVAIEVTVAADYGIDLELLARRIRWTVADQIHRYTGLTCTAVSVIIDDVLLDDVDEL